jgi:2-hydroxychromene-2-carboxylate isomerase
VGILRPHAGRLLASGVRPGVPAAIGAALAAAGLDLTDWQTWRETRGQADLAAAQARAESLGVFGAPTFVYRGELFWGSDRVDLLAATLDASAACSS